MSTKGNNFCNILFVSLDDEILSESESELFTGETSKDNHSPGPVIKGVSP